MLTRLYQSLHFLCLLRRIRLVQCPWPLLYLRSTSAFCSLPLLWPDLTLLDMSASDSHFTFTPPYCSLQSHCLLWQVFVHDPWLNSAFLSSLRFKPTISVPCLLTVSSLSFSSSEDIINLPLFLKDIFLGIKYPGLTVLSCLNSF